MKLEHWRLSLSVLSRGRILLKDDIALSIIKSILLDIQGRYGLDNYVFGSTERSEINATIAMFETWRQLIALELHNHGMISEKYEPLTKEELKHMSFYDVLELRDFYMR
ncbi:hypothetical protein ACHHV8_02590 [Paenibacillus sp. TAB 01]|uniref:hypothetical protein n=1 Tax=Paenibacillus sp. TAB 01 TaxID=3368988 RepID=UPI00374FEC3C